MSKPLNANGMKRRGGVQILVNLIYLLGERIGLISGRWIGRQTL
jgi:hypothetical protein